jgi:hypothetical protein
MSNSDEILISFDFSRPLHEDKPKFVILLYVLYKQ